MPTKSPRIAVVRDAELSRALDRTRTLLDTDSAAAHVRALALRGAQAVIAEAGPRHEPRARLVDRHGIRPATGDLADLDPPADPFDPDDPTPATEALRWARGD